MRAGLQKQVIDVAERLQETTLTPMLWEDGFRKLELRGSPVLDQARDREAALRSQWAEIAKQLPDLPQNQNGHNGAAAAPDLTEEGFLKAAAVVLAHALYLPAARCFALVPLAGHMRRTGNRDGCEVDFDVGARLPLCCCQFVAACFAQHHGT